MAIAKRLGLAVPCGDMMHSESAFALAALSRTYNGQVAFIRAQSSIIAQVRNNAIHAAQNAGCDWLLMIDSDMVYPADTADRLLAAERDIVGAVYMRRTYPFETMGVPKGGSVEANTGLVEMDVIPTGLLLINMKVFEKLRKPYFRTPANEMTGTIEGEDYTFSKMARNSGFRIFADIDLSKRVGHCSMQVLADKAFYEERQVVVGNV